LTDPLSDTLDDRLENSGRFNGKTALMWGGLLTLFASLFHFGLLLAGPKHFFLAGIPKVVSSNIPLGDSLLLVLVAIMLLGVSFFAFQSSRELSRAQKRRPVIAFIGVIILIWGVTGAPFSHLDDWSHGYSIFHVAAAFFITLTGSCFLFAAWSLKQV